MRLLIILVTVFSVCCCFSVLNIFPLETNGRKLHLMKRTIESDILTEEEILRCQAYMDKIVGDLNQRSHQEDLQDISFKCSLILQNIKLSAGKTHNNINREPPFEDQNNQEHELKIQEHESSKEVNSKSTGSSKVPNSDLFTENYEDFSTEKPSDKRENQKTEFDSVRIKPVITSWSIWSYFYGPSDSKDSSKGDQIATKLEKNQNADSGLNFKNSMDFEFTTEMAIWNIVMPGTKWCGSGDIAKNDDDLGYFKDVDICCRAHDKCDDIMWPGETKYNLTNNSAFTLLNCKCDDDLYNCLSQIDSVASNTIGNTFFNIFGRKCYTLDYPQSCKKHNSKLECIEYENDKTAEKVYQWKPAKKYHRYPFTIPG